MGPVCLYPNYLKTFLQKYPDYKLNVGEYFILELYTDLVDSRTIINLLLQSSFKFFKTSCC